MRAVNLCRDWFLLGGLLSRPRRSPRTGLPSRLCRTGHHSPDRHGSAGRVRESVSPVAARRLQGAEAAVFGARTGAGGDCRD